MKPKQLKSLIWPMMLLSVVIAMGCDVERTPQQDSRLRFQKALQYINKRDMSEAISELRYAIQLDHEFADPYYKLGVVYQEIGGTEQAVTYFNQYLEFEPDHLDTHLRLMRIFYFTGRFDEAIEKGEYLLARSKKGDKIQAEMHGLLGDVYLKIQDSEAAAFHFEQALKIRPDSIETYMKLVNLYQNKGDAEKARTLLDKVITLKPSYAEPYHLLAEIYTLEQKDSALMELYKKIIELEPDKVLPRIKLVQLYFKHKKYESAQAVVTEILELDPSEPAAHFLLGRIYLIKEQYVPAVQELSKARIAKYELDDTLSLLGNAYQKLMQWDNALKAYETLVFIRPEQFDVQLNLAKLYLRVKQWDEAADKAAEIIYRFYGFEEAYLLQGLAHMQGGDWDAAQDDFQDFFAPDKKLDEAGMKFYLKMYPNLVVPQRFKRSNPRYSVLGHYLLGICHLAKSDLRSAQAEFERAIAVGIPFVDAHILKAITNHMQGKSTQAIKSCNMALRFTEDDQSRALVHFVLANIYTSQGELIKAQEHMRQAEGAVAEFSFFKMDITKNISEKAPLSLARLNLGVIYLQYGWKTAAKAECQLALKDNPHNPLANYIVDELYKLTSQYYDKHNRLDGITEKLLEYP